MISKRVTSFFRRITVCLTISLASFLFVLSCQKDEGLKQKNPNALTKSQAKEYFEQTASTLKFLTTGTTPTGTKNADYSLTENMIINWDQALEGETADSYVVEIPIRMASPITALLYDGIGHYNKNIRQVQMNTSLLIEKHKADGCLHHSVVTTVGSYSTTANSKYGFLCDKSSFSGYQIFSSEEGSIISSIYFSGSSEQRKLFSSNEIRLIDSTGQDLLYRGITFILSKGALTKGGGGTSSGELTKCPYCDEPIDMSQLNGNYYYCSCGAQFEILIDPFLTYCNVCGFLLSDCKCCGTCHLYPCICTNVCPECKTYPCICNIIDTTGVNDPILDMCQILVYSYPSVSYGTIIISPAGDMHGIGTNVCLTALPNVGYSFVRWECNNTVLSTSNPYQFLANTDQIIYAVFEEI